MNEQIRYDNGEPCCYTFDDAHNPIPSNPAHHCKACQEYFAAMARFPAPATLEGRRHSQADQRHIDAAAGHVTAALDRLHSAGARHPGAGQMAEADLEREERGASSYPPPDPYEAALAARAVAERRAGESNLEERVRQERDYRVWRERELAGERERRLAEAPTLVVLSDAERQAYAPPDPYQQAVIDWRAKEQRR